MQRLFGTAMPCGGVGGECTVKSRCCFGAICAIAAGGPELGRSCAERVWASFVGPAVFWPLAPGAIAWANGCAADGGARSEETASPADFSATGVSMLPSCAQTACSSPSGDTRINGLSDW